MLLKDGININSLAELPLSNETRATVQFANHTFVKKDTRVGFVNKFDFLTQGQDLIADMGTRPRFNLIKSFTTAGNHTLERKGNDIYCDNQKILNGGKCLIVEICGAGGGGAGGWSLDNGSGGGAGGYVCIILDFTKNAIYNVAIGQGGNGAQGSGAGGQGSNGGTTYIRTNGAEVCRGDGGRGAKGHHGADGGNGFVSSGYIGFTHWGHAGAVEEQNAYIENFAITGITPFNEPSINRGNFQSNGSGNNTGGGGGCSALAKGGNGGTKANGQNGTLGSGGGGGGARKTTTGGRGGDGVLNIYY